MQQRLKAIDSNSILAADADKNAVEPSFPDDFDLTTEDDVLVDPWTGVPLRPIPGSFLPQVSHMESIKC